MEKELKINPEDLKKITGAGEWDEVPPVDEHDYDDDTVNKG